MTIQRTDTVTFTTSTDSPQTINVNSSEPAIKITQQGSGYALHVEDSPSDSSPFIVDTNGNVISGCTTNFNIGGVSHLSNWMAASPYYSAAFGYTGDSIIGARLSLVKSRGSTWGTHGLVVNNDNLATLNFCADDGTDYTSIAASIRANVDAAASANNTPGRITFLTTSPDASTPTERMRIRSDGNVGIGTSGAVNATLSVAGDLTGGVSAYGLLQSGIVQSDVTTSASYNRTVAGVEDVSFTLPELRHYAAVQDTFGASATVTSQFGFLASSTLTGATNNYGFYGALPDAANRWNFYGAGTAPNYFAGDVRIGTTTAGASKLVVNDDSIQLNTAKTPASAAATGTTGEICWDASYIYVCVATNTWKRAAISTW